MNNTASACTRDSQTEARQHWMGVLAKAPLTALEQSWNALGAKPGYDFLRKPEVGLCMIRARAGGNGVRFNLGEMTMTRVAVRLESGTVGYGYVAGRAVRHAELAAVFDALLQDTERQDAIIRDLVEPAERAERQRQDMSRAKAAATKVEFFTVVRGEDGA